MDKQLKIDALNALLVDLEYKSNLICQQCDEIKRKPLTTKLIELKTLVAELTFLVEKHNKVEKELNKLVPKFTADDIPF